MPGSTPPLLVRLAVTLGSLALLIGIVGLVTFESPDPALSNVPRALLVAVPTDALPVVTVAWVEQGIEVRQDARPGDRYRVWELPPLPEDLAVTLTVRDELTDAILAEQVLKPPHRTLIPVDLSGP